MREVPFAQVLVVKEQRNMYKRTVLYGLFLKLDTPQVHSLDSCNLCLQLQVPKISGTEQNDNESVCGYSRHAKVKAVASKAIVQHNCKAFHSLAKLIKTS